MISTFTTELDPEDPLTPFLFGIAPPPDKELLEAKWRKSIEYQRPGHGATYQFTEASHILSAAQRKLCVKFLDTVWSAKAPHRTVGDMKIVFAEDAIETLL